MVLIKNALNMVEAMVRMAKNNEAIIFDNEGEDIRLMLRPEGRYVVPSDPNEPIPHMVDFELCMLPEDSKDVTAFRNDTDLLEEDEDTFVAITLKIQDEEDVQTTMNRINDVYAWRKCGCTKYIIKDDHACCLFCNLTADKQDLDEHFCCICQTNGVLTTMCLQRCCTQFIHKSCMHNYLIKHDTSVSPGCPLCRQQQTEKNKIICDETMAV